MNTQTITIRVEVKSTVNTGAELRQVLDAQRGLLAANIYDCLRDALASTLDGAPGADWTLNVDIEQAGE